MIVLIPDANAILIDNKKIGIFNQSVQSDYISTCESYTNGYNLHFIQCMQCLMTKLGLIISKVSTPKWSISYCAQSISYICNTVLDKPELQEDFKKVGLNDKGNVHKHSLTPEKINMEHCVNLYNRTVQMIISKYNLTALNNLLVKKRLNQKLEVVPEKPIIPAIPKQPAIKSAPIKKNKKNNPSEKSSTSDEIVKLSAELLRGDGRYEKGFFKKEKMLNFRLQINITPADTKISEIYAEFKCNNNIVQKNLSRETQSETKIDLPVKTFSGNINATVYARYKIGLFKTKEIKVSVSKNF